MLVLARRHWARSVNALSVNICHVSSNVIAECVGCGATRYQHHNIITAQYWKCEEGGVVGVGICRCGKAGGDGAI